jgi:hypothetical protein
MARSAGAKARSFYTATSKFDRAHSMWDALRRPETTFVDIDAAERPKPRNDSRQRRFNGSHQSSRLRVHLTPALFTRDHRSPRHVTSRQRISFASLVADFIDNQRRIPSTPLAQTRSIAFTLVRKPGLKCSVIHEDPNR